MPAVKKKKKGGRPRKHVDLERVRQLAVIGATQEEIASDQDCSVTTLTAFPGFREAYKTGGDKGKMSLRHKQYEMAMAGDRTMCVWLGKQWLLQKDKQEISGDEAQPLILQLRRVENKEDG